MIQAIFGRGIAIRIDGHEPKPGWVVKVADDSQSVLFYTTKADKDGRPSGIQSTDEGLEGATPGVMIGDRKLIKIDLFAPMYDPDKRGYAEFWRCDEAGTGPEIGTKREIALFWEDGTETHNVVDAVVGSTREATKVMWGNEEVEISEVQGYIITDDSGAMAQTGHLLDQLKERLEVDDDDLVV